MSKLPSGALVVRCAFAALVLATFAAFFVTTRLKRSPPVVEQLSFRGHFSPNGDGRLDVETIAFHLRRNDDVTVSIVSRDGDRVATIADDVALAKGPHRLRWNGRARGRVVPDGDYRVRIILRRQNRVVTSPRKLFVDTTPPRSVVRSVSPDAIYPGIPGADRARIRYVGPGRIAPTLLVYATDGSRPRLVARRSGRRGSSILSWDGRVAGGARARAGNYLMVVRSRDAAGNDGPVGPPPRRPRGHPGLVVRYLAALAPSRAASARQRVRFAVLAAGARYRWSVSKLGSRKRLARGLGRAPTLVVRAPARRRSGLYLLRLARDRHRYAAPFAVRGTTGSRVLVVLPTTSWIARDPLDSSGGGYPDILPPATSVPTARPITADGLPAGFESSVAPFLRFLDGAGLRYDIATDLELARPARLRRYRGVVFAAAPIVLPGTVAANLRAWTRLGGTLAWFGTGGFTASARVGEEAIDLLPTPPGRNYFGEKLGRAPAGPLAIERDRSHLFEGLATTIAPIGRLEPALAPAVKATPSSAAGPAGAGPALVVYPEGSGRVVRLGATGLAASLAGGGEGALIMRNLWKLLRS